MILVSLLVALVAGVGPVVVYALIVWWFDRYEKEPWPLLLGAFLWGAVPATLLSVIAEFILDVPLQFVLGEGLALQSVRTALVAPVVEEIVKGAAVLAVFLWFRREFDSVLDGIVYGSLVGFGFAAVENVLATVGSMGEGGLEAMMIVIFMRSFLFGLSHALYTSLTGIGLALARSSRQASQKVVWPMLGLLLAMGAHALHNGSIMAGVASGSLIGPLLGLVAEWIGVLVLLAIVIGATLQERGWLVRGLADEVNAGTITAQQYVVAVSYWRRFAERARALLSGQADRFLQLGRFHQAMTHLAFRKHQLAALGDEGRNRVEVERWRGEVAVVRVQLEGRRGNAGAGPKGPPGTVR
jgi:RsiW-degrading membrane proteinase PrsW (M82 family)